jgi:hypothetical protein
MLHPKKVVQFCFDHSLFKKNRVFVTKICCFWLEIALWLSFLANVEFSTQKQHIFCHKNSFFEKGYDQKMFGPLFSESVYVSDAKTTFGMFGIFCFAVLKLTDCVNRLKIHLNYLLSFPRSPS